MKLHDNSIASQTDHYVNVFVRENIAYGMTLFQRFDIQKFDVNAILYRKKQRKKNGFFIF